MKELWIMVARPLSYLPARAIAGLVLLILIIGSVASQAQNQPLKTPPALPSVDLRGAGADAANDPLTLVEAHLRAARTMTADFTQEAGGGRVSQGRMVLARPGKVRFEYGAKASFLIVANGKTLSLVDYEVAQVSRWPVRDTPLAILLDPTVGLRERARILSAGPGALANRIVVEAQDRKRPDYGTLTLYFVRSASGPGGLSLQGWQVLDPQGNTTTVSLSNVRYNIQVAENAFTYREPAGFRSLPGGRTR
jgi:outer membrane lipoprotein-sorting protein